jgi:uncharacterized membrane protein YkoI
MTRTVLIAVVVVLLAALSGGIAIGAGRGDDAEQPITGAALARASAAALERTGGGRVTETEVGDEEGAYEVEVTRPDGSQVDVHLDKHFNVLNSVADDDRSGEGDD